MNAKMEMSLGVSLLMSEITEKLLYAVEERNGEKVVVDRDIPFRLRYRLNKNRVMFNKDVQFFNRQKLLYLAQYGEPTADGQDVIIKDEHKLELYKSAISNLLDSKVDHTIMTLEPEDLELINDSDIKISPEAMTLFIGYMTNDPELEKDLATEVRINPRPVEEKPVPDEVETPRVIPDGAETPKATKKAPAKKATKASDDGAEKPKKTRAKKSVTAEGQDAPKPKKTTTRKKKETTNEQ